MDGQAPQDQPTQPVEQAPAVAPTPEPAVAANPAAPAPATGSEDPGKGLGIASLVCALLGISLIGLILGIMGKKKSKQAGHSNGAAVAGIVISVLGMVASLIVGIIIAVGMMAAVSKCNDLGPGTHIENGVTYTCS